MVTIQSTGKKNGKKTEVVFECYDEYAEGRFNGKPDQEMEMDVIRQLPTVMVGGTYRPQTLALKIVGVLTSGFFDLPPDRVDVIGDIEQIPYEEGVIY